MWPTDWKRVGESVLIYFHQSTDINTTIPTSSSPFKPDNLPKTPSPYTITLRLRLEWILVEPKYSVNGRSNKHKWVEQGYVEYWKTMWPFIKLKEFTQHHINPQGDFNNVWQPETWFDPCCQARINWLSYLNYLLKYMSFYLKSWSSWLFQPSRPFLSYSILFYSRKFFPEFIFLM